MDIGYFKKFILIKTFKNFFLFTILQLLITLKIW